MAEGVCVPTDGMWSLADELPVKSGYSLGSGADGPLSREEIATFGQELGARAERWRIASDLHLLDMMRFHSRGWR